MASTAVRTFTAGHRQLNSSSWPDDNMTISSDSFQFKSGGGGSTSQSAYRSESNTQYVRSSGYETAPVRTSSRKEVTKHLDMDYGSKIAVEEPEPVIRPTSRPTTPVRAHISTIECNIYGQKPKPKTAEFDERLTIKEAHPCELKLKKPEATFSPRPEPDLMSLLHTAEVRDHVDSSRKLKDTDRHAREEPKGYCAVCNKGVFGRHLIVNDKLYHPEHFCCSECGVQIGQGNYFEKDGKFYCENDYYRLFAARCAYCNGPIKDKCVMALGKAWHVEHFLCAICGRSFDESGYHVKDGRAVCSDCLTGTLAPTCKGCKQPILEWNFMSVLEDTWHQDCFALAESVEEFI